MQGVIAKTRVIAAGNYGHSLAVRDDGTVWAWGWNSYGQLGDGTNVNSATPVQVVGLTGVKEIAAGAGFSIALKNDGTVWAWGLNSRGQLGDGTTMNRSAPVSVSGMTGVTAIATGSAGTVNTGYSFALKTDGTVWAWGDDSLFYLGDFDSAEWKSGTPNAFRTAPVQLYWLTDVTAISSSTSSTSNGYTLALKGDGTIWIWGIVEGIWLWKQLPEITGVTEIAAGADGYIALKADGTVWAGGYAQDQSAVVGDLPGNTTMSSPWLQVADLTDVTMIVADYRYYSALKSDGTVWEWGLADCMLPDGTIKDASSRTALQMSGFNDATEITSMSALKADGTVWEWMGGRTSCNSSGNTTISLLTPVQVPAPGGIGFFNLHV